MTALDTRLDALREQLEGDQATGPAGTKLSLDALLDGFIAFTEEIKHRKVEPTEHVKKFLAKCASPAFQPTCEGSLTLPASSR